MRFVLLHHNKTVLQLKLLNLILQWHIFVLYTYISLDNLSDLASEPLYLSIEPTNRKW